MQELFSYKQTGVGKDGKVLGHFQATGVRPKFSDRLRAFGTVLSDSMFDPSRLYE
jgi:pilus assembly protein CpaF